MKHLKRFNENLNIKEFDNECLYLLKDRLTDFTEDLGYEKVEIDLASRDLYPNITGKFYTLASHELQGEATSLIKSMINSMLDQKLFLINFSIHTPISRELLKRIQGRTDSIIVYKNLNEVPKQLLKDLNESYNEFNSNFIPSLNNYGFKCESSYSDSVKVTENIDLLKTGWTMKVFYENVYI